MTNWRAALAAAIVMAPLVVVILLLPVLPSPWNMLVALAVSAVYLACLAAGKRDAPRTIRLSKIHYFLVIVAVGVMAMTYLLMDSLGEAASWLRILFVAELAFSLPFILYAIVASILPE